jgi:membrane-associated phospholipid phosphatase
MDVLMTSGIHAIVLLQSVGWLEAAMRFFTFVGSPDFAFVILPAIYWCIDSRLGVRIALIVFASSMLNEVAKLALQGPRPYWVSLQVKALASEPGFGVPSGHAQIAVGVWGMVAATLRRGSAWAAAIVLILLIGVSRVYLGVHYPHDVVVGWIIGVLLLWLFLAAWIPVSRWIGSKALSRQAVLSIAICLAFLTVDAMMVRGLSHYVSPADWLTNAARAGGMPPPGVSMDPMLTYAGAFLGFVLGLAWIAKGVGFAPSGSFRQRALCFIIGLAGVLVLYAGLKAAFPSGERLVGLSLRFVRYAALGLWISAGAPAVFQRLQLMPAPSETTA